MSTNVIAVRGGGGHDAAMRDVAKTNVRYGSSSNLVRTLGLDGARVVGAGAFGVAYAVPITAAFLRAITTTMRGGAHHRVRGPAIPKVGVVIVKIATMRPGWNVTRFAESNVLEASTHRQLSGGRRASTCAELLPGTRVCPASVVARFYCAGMVDDAFFTVMAFVPGKTLSETWPITPRILAGVEVAAAVLWAAGVVHNDFHAANIMVNAATGRVKIIDLGLAVVLPASMRAALTAQVRHALASNTPTLGTITDFEPALIKTARVRRRPDAHVHTNFREIRGFGRSVNKTNVPALRREILKNLSARGARMRGQSSA